LRKTFDFSEEEHFAAAFGQGVDGFGQQCKFLRRQTKLHDVGLIFQDWQTGGFRYRNQLGPLPAREKVAYGVAGDGEKQRLRRADFSRSSRTYERAKTILHKIVHVGQ